ncbi:MAG TPA: response regulator transcription factor [Polyangiaceae bacterium]|nr:response regulator transcription factor [Polyangiaceae bacterium]
MVPPSHPARRIRIVTADDHAVVRAGLRALLGRQADMEVVGDASSARELEECVRRTKPDVVVVDLRMPGGGVLDAVHVASHEVGAAVVIFSAFDDVSDAAHAFRAGASGYVLKQSLEGDLVTAIRRVRAGKRYVDPPLAARMMEERIDLEGDGPMSRLASLTEREALVLDLVARGHTGPEIATELGVRLGTVETFRHRIRKKLGLKSRAEVTQFARASGFRRERP